MVLAEPDANDKMHDIPDLLHFPDINSRNRTCRHDLRKGRRGPEQDMRSCTEPGPRHISVIGQ